MADFTCQLDMAGSVWEITSPFEVPVGDNCVPFLTEGRRPDCRIRFRPGLPEERGTLLRERAPRVWQEDGALRVERVPVMSAEPCASVWLRKDDPLRVEGLIYPGQEKTFRALNTLLDVAELELMLLALGAVSLHSSLVRRREGDAILFTAPSGTGKSTQASLWERHAGADTLNGDRSILRRLDGVWRAFGSPFAGSSGIYRNESAPIRALVVLRQAPENRIRRLGAAEAFRALYSESILPRWNTEAHSEVIDLVTALAAGLPVYLLACTPDARPVTLLQNTLEGDPV